MAMANDVLTAPFGRFPLNISLLSPAPPQLLQLATYGAQGAVIDFRVAIDSRLVL
jgi:hypothetical protein